MWPRQTDEIGPTGHQDGIYMVGLVDVANRHGRNVALVANAV